MSNIEKNNEVTFRALCACLVSHFPDYNLIQEEGHWNCYFQNKNEPSKGFYLNPSLFNGRFTVTPRIIKTPHFSIGNVYDTDNKRIESPSVGFSVGRPADQVAKGIKTRFFPDFEIYYSHWIRAWDNQNNYKNGLENTSRALAAVMDIPASKMERASNGEIRSEFSAYWSTNERLRRNISKIFVSSEKSVQVTTDYLTTDQVMKLIEFLKTI
jgi:hypothetical protein